MATIMNINSNGTGLSIGTEKAVANTFSCNLPTFDLKNSSANDVSIIFNRGASSANWKLLNQGGTLKIQNDWTSSKVNYFDVLKLSHASGDVEISKGNLNLPNANKIYWKENGYGDQFAIVPSFGGTDDSNLLQFQAAVGGAGTTPSLYNVMTISGKSGNVSALGEIISTGENAFRAVHENYGVIFRNDGGGFHLLITKRGDPYGRWRMDIPYPFYVNLDTGVCYINDRPGNVSIGTSATPSGNKGNIYIQY